MIRILPREKADVKGRQTSASACAARASFFGEGSVTVKRVAKVNQTSARIVAVASYSPVVTPSEGLTGAPPGHV